MHYLLLLLLFLVGTAPSSRIASSDEEDREIVVQGTGVVRVLPDRAFLHFAIVTRASRPGEARQRNAEAAARVLNALRRLGVEEKHMRLTALRLSEYRERTPDGKQFQRGFEAYRSLAVEVDDLEQIPEIIARVVEEGSNRLLGLSYDVRDRQAVERQALEQAALNARAKAEALARVLGASLGRVLRIQEQGMHMPYPLHEVRMQVAAAKVDATAEPEAYAVGEIEVRASVQVTFALD